MQISFKPYAGANVEFLSPEQWVGRYIGYRAVLTSGTLETLNAEIQALQEIIAGLIEAMSTGSRYHFAQRFQVEIREAPVA